VKPHQFQSPLGKPGAGLPLFERLVARYFFLPVKARQTTWEQSNRMFERETEKILKLTESLSVDELKVQVLIPRIHGIEDNSRNWSPAMVLEHLMIVATGMAEVIVQLSCGKVPDKRVDIAAVKPKGEFSAVELSAIREQFSNRMAAVKQSLAQDVRNHNSRSRLRHPWFGSLTAREWNWLLGAHQRIHRKQIEEIQKRLR